MLESIRNLVAEISAAKYNSDGSAKIIGIIPTLTNVKIYVSDYFILSSYKDASGKENKCYKVTKLGCDFLTNKFNGEKDVIFTVSFAGMEMVA